MKNDPVTPSPSVIRDADFIESIRHKVRDELRNGFAIDCALRHRAVDQHRKVRDADSI